MTMIHFVSNPGALLPIPEHLSYSQVSQLSGRYKYSCARKWAYGKRLGLEETISPALALGSAFDAAANNYFGDKGMGILHATAMETALKTGLMNLEVDLESRTFSEEITQTKAKRLQASLDIGMRAFFAKHKDVEAWGVQNRHEFVINGITHIGWSDRIDKDGTINDHKWSGSKRWDQNGAWDLDWVSEKRDQLVGYWLGRRAEFTRTAKAGLPWDQPPVTNNGRIVVVYMRAGNKTAEVRSIDLEFDREDQERVLANVIEADKTRKSGRYPARPGPACGFCSFVARCRNDSIQSEPLFADLTGVPEVDQQAGNDRILADGGGVL